MNAAPRSSRLCSWHFIFGLSSFASDVGLVHAKIYPSPTARPIEDGTILVHDGRIQAVGPAAQIKVPTSKAVTMSECRGLVVTAGFWNSHIHILTPGLLHAEKLPADQLSAQLETPPATSQILP
jgi:cytosine/adenosine deaminase-related metal-dependent hydrolase